MLRTIQLLTIILWILAGIPLSAQQVPDLDFTPGVKQKRYKYGQGPIIGVDGAHNNLHQLDGGFAPFGKLVNADGYITLPINKLDQDALQQLDIYVIANALHASNVGNWQNPVPSAFTNQEVEMLEEWVLNGGSLLVIADHMPYGGAARELAKHFGFVYENGFVVCKDQQWPPEMYRKNDQSLYPGVLTMRIDSLAGFTGSALKAAPGAMTVGSFPKTHQLLLPDVAWQFDENTASKPLGDYTMGAAMRYGKGKVAFFTEAAMFTAQIVQEKYKVGFNAPGAPQNQQFVLNVIHWLDDDSPESKVYENLYQMGQAFESDDMGAIADLYTRDGVIYLHSGGEIRGGTAINDYWQKLKGRAVSWKFWLLEVEQSGEQITAIFRLDLTYKDQSGKTHTSPSRAMLIYKEEDGAYKLYRDFYIPVK